MATTIRTMDELDRELVDRLRADGRESNRSLAAALGVNETTVAARLRRLAADGVMRVVAVADMHAFGLGCMGCGFVRVGDRTPHEVAGAIAQLPAATGVVVCSGRFGVIVNVMTRDVRELAEVVAGGIMSVPGVAEVRCDLVVDAPRFDSRFSGRAVLLDDALPTPPFGDGHHDLDVALVTELQRDARVSNRRIAAKLMISEATVRSRLRRLEEQGSVRIQAICDVESFGLTSHGYVTVRAAPGRMQEACDLLVAEHELGFVGRTLGSADFVCFAACPSREELLDLVMTRLAGADAIAEAELYEGCGTFKHVYTWAQL
jgi:Lrp/AsnC family transcriptional regulator for asnA, asnC and gidA